MRYEPGGTCRIRRLAHLDDFALPLIECLDTLPRKAHWGDFCSYRADRTGTTGIVPSGERSLRAE